MYNNPYFNPYNSQITIDRIDGNINQLQQLKEQLTKNNMPQTPTNLTQNFSLSPMPQNSMKFATSLDEVNKEMVYIDTPFFSKDMSVMWLKNAKGEVKSYELNEIVQKDEKDIKIDYLTAQIEDLQRRLKDEPSNTNFNQPIEEPIENEKSTSSTSIRASKKKQ